MRGPSTCYSGFADKLIAWGLATYAHLCTHTYAHLYICIYKSVRLTVSIDLCALTYYERSFNVLLRICRQVDRLGVSYICTLMHTYIRTLVYMHIHMHTFFAEM